MLGDVIAMLSGTVGELAQFWAFEDLVSRLNAEGVVSGIAGVVLSVG